MDSERRAHLLRIVERARLAYQAWVEHGDSHLVPEDELYERYNEIAEQARVISAQRAEPLELLFLGVAPHWQAFVSAQQATADTTMLPGQEFWAAWEKLAAAAAAAKLPKLKHIETIAELYEQRVPLAQICRIYGFLDDDGNPDLQKLREERAEPGKHTGNGWVAPVNRDLKAKIDQANLEADMLERRRAAKIAAATTPARESIEQLVADGVSAVQIANMKRTSVEAVLDYCRQHNLPAPAMDYSGLMQQPGAHDPEISPERQAAMDRLGNETSPQLGKQLDLGEPLGEDDSGGIADDVLERLAALPPDEQNQIQEAVTYFQGGMTLQQIAANLGGLHVNKVRALLAKAGVDPSAAPANA